MWRDAHSCEGLKLDSGLGNYPAREPQPINVSGSWSPWRRVDELVSATSSPAVGDPGRLREAVEGSLRRLRLERIDLYQLARIDPTVPATDQFGALAELRQQGKIRHVGLSEVGSTRCRRRGRSCRSPRCRTATASPTGPGSPSWTTASTRVSRSCRGSPLARAASSRLEGHWWRSHGATTPRRPRSPWPGCCGARRSCCRSPGTSSVAHLEENLAASALRLHDDEFHLLASM